MRYHILLLIIVVSIILTGCDPRMSYIHKLKNIQNDIETSANRNILEEVFVDQSKGLSPSIGVVYSYQPIADKPIDLGVDSSTWVGKLFFEEYSESYFSWEWYNFSL